MSETTTAELVKRYTDYRAKNTEIKRRQALERQAELEPYLADVGGVVAALRAVGHGLPALAELISNRNRNFLYQAMRAYDESEGRTTDKPKSTPKPKAKPKPVPVDPEKGYRIDRTENVRGVTEVWVGQDYFPLVYADGVHDIPELWLTEQDPERKALYRKILQELETDE